VDLLKNSGAFTPEESSEYLKVRTFREIPFRSFCSRSHTRHATARCPQRSLRSRSLDRLHWPLHRPEEAQAAALPPPGRRYLHPAVRHDPRPRQGASVGGCLDFIAFSDPCPPHLPSACVSPVPFLLRCALDFSLRALSVLSLGVKCKHSLLCFTGALDKRGQTAEEGLCPPFPNRIPLITLAHELGAAASPSILGA
jgi:hypothetical protein